MERIAREQEEALRLQELIQREHEAEERQRRENEKRDHEEDEERKRVKKEEQMRLMAEKDHRILMLTTELDSQKALFASERLELENELERMLQLKEALLNELSVLRSESDETQRSLLDEHQKIVARCEALQQQQQQAHRQFAENKACLEEQLAASSKDLERAKKEHDDYLALKDRQDRDMMSRLKNLERELEKTSSLNRTLQEVIESREADDRKNVTLMQLLNNQLDDNKRRSQELLEEERGRTTRAKQEIAQLQASLQQTKEESDLHKQEKEVLKRQSEADTQEYKEKLEQMKFDMKYLHSELHSFKQQCTKQQQESTTVKSTAAIETQSARIEVESFQKKVEELEALVRRKDREHFDKVTFLNAQISNNRTIIGQLQQKLAKEREDRAQDVNHVQVEVSNKTLAIHALSTDLEKKKVTSQEIESKLQADVSILKSTVFQLQAQLFEKEKESETLRASHEEEIKRLRLKLDEHFIPHRNEIEANPSQNVSVETVLNEKITKLTRDIEIRNRVAVETETRLKAQLTNQNQIIDALQGENRKSKTEWSIEVKALEEENNKLKRTLDVHFIPYQK